MSNEQYTFDSLFLCILNVTHNRTLSVMTSYIHYFTNNYEGTKFSYRQLLKVFLHLGSLISKFRLCPFLTFSSGHKCILFCALIITHDRILSIRTSYIHFFTKYCKTINLLTHSYWRYFTLQIYWKAIFLHLLGQIYQDTSVYCFGDC